MINDCLVIQGIQFLLLPCTGKLPYLHYHGDEVCVDSTVVHHGSSTWKPAVGN